MDQPPKHNSENQETLRRTYRDRVCDLGLGDGFWDVMPNAQATKEKKNR